MCTEKSRRLLSYFIAPQKNKNQYKYNENVNFFYFLTGIVYHLKFISRPASILVVYFVVTKPIFCYTFLLVFLFGLAVIGNITFPYTARHLDIPSRERRSLAALNSRSGMCVSPPFLSPLASSCSSSFFFFLRYTHTHLYRAT